MVLTRIKNFIIYKLFNKEENRYRRVSYSQSGEDIIMYYLLDKVLQIKSITYMDIGTYHPFHMNNTFLFYKAGFKGVCIEPNPVLFKEIEKNRKNDICLNSGVGETEGKFQFYLMSDPSLSTFSKNEAEEYEAYTPNKIVNVLNMNVENINQIIKKHLNVAPTIVSIDVEGKDAEIIRSFNFSIYRPVVFCIETVRHTTEEKNQEIFELMRENKYVVYADTFINTIFVDQYLWEQRYKPR